jgi:hypothetical protein
MKYPRKRTSAEESGWWWSRLKTGEKVATIVGVLTLIVAILAIPGVVEKFHRAESDENVAPKAPSGLSVEPGGYPKILSNGSVEIATNEAEKLVVKRVKPDWPKGMESKVYSVQVFVGEDGKVIGVATDVSDRQILEAIDDAVAQWRFKPYLMDGKPQKFQSVFYLHS